jgi:hypothetical protein
MMLVALHNQVLSHMKATTIVPSVLDDEAAEPLVYLGDNVQLASA